MGDELGEMEFDDDSGGAADMEFDTAPEEGGEEEPERQEDEE